MSNQTIFEVCRSRGVSRRRFMQFCATAASTLVLPSSYASVIAEALTSKRKPTLVWLEFQDCTGNTEAMLRSSHPSIEDIVLESVSMEYHETIMAGSGKHATAALERIVKEEKGKYLVIVEGSVPMVSIAPSVGVLRSTSRRRYAAAQLQSLPLEPARGMVVWSPPSRTPPAQ